MYLRKRYCSVTPGSVVEIGVGSGVVLASLLAAGATTGLGVDVDPEAVRRTWTC